MCCLYKAEEEHWAFLARFLRLGLERGEKVLYSVATDGPEPALISLQGQGLEVERPLARGQLRIVSAEATYLLEGTFDADRMIALLGTETARALAEGYPGLRVAGEMTWSCANPRGSESLIEYEAKVNSFFPTSKCTGLCFYDQRLFSAVVLLNVLYTHPICVAGTAICDNFYYLPPEDFLGNDVPAAVLRSCMRNLVARNGLRNQLYDARELLMTALGEKFALLRELNEAGRKEVSKPKGGRRSTAKTQGSR
jgi:hypothetical protein